ncbi:tRNA 2-thiouridine(34) synthase MnmA [Dokdonella fugitiva]|uniref:tRNA-specific 2-thiouridylase MnmA n=1 Tax=Dokdonella fugitiva TaxID=328517 RepID=A0A4R2I898_9GAMM|nr:tRNA 2-thiouridine(34) synthase MnmA [Dokdonella fugitiva]MBA8883205.1 tRNA-specific 2-thiouridylase [Dokdonella fugitiva]TCO40337.1 tRNA-specific 2-thiouridylase [Dokdonella fugitiva]
MTARVIVGISGGVDSSVAALLLQRAGESIAGLFMQNWEEDERRGPCRADEDRRDAVAVCAKLGIPLYLRNFADEYWDQVFEHFLAEYRRGRTPNPDVLCNREIKFKTFLDHAHALGAEKIATGHYARVDCVDGRWRLLRARDTAKDQTYFLHALGQPALASTLFPLGDMHKADVRAVAREADLATHDKKDSTGICFIGERDFRSFLAEYIPARPGPMRTPDGTTVGEHAGVFYYTLGQRSGLGIGGRRGGEGEPWYVIGKNVADNVLYVAQGNANHWLQSRRLAASGPTWVAGEAPAASFRCSAMTRYRQEPQACSVELDATGCTVVFDAPQRAVTPGQSVVFYDDDVCLGGAVIECSDAPYGGWEMRDA